MIKSEIISIANDYSSQYNSYPFDVYKLISDLKLLIVEESLKADGYFINMNKCQRIYINKDMKNERRKRFTLAHEIGHYVLHGEHPILKVKNTKDYFNFAKELQNIEAEANLFASELLSPSNKVKEILPNNSIKLDNIEEVSSFFNISFTSAAIKCIENSKTYNELLIFFDNNDEYKWFCSANDEWTNEQMPKSSSETEYFFKDIFKKSTLNIESCKLNSYGTIYLLSGIIKEDYDY